MAIKPHYSLRVSSKFVLLVDENVNANISVQTASFIPAGSTQGLWELLLFVFF